MLCSCNRVDESQGWIIYAYIYCRENSQELLFLQSGSRSENLVGLTIFRKNLRGHVIYITHITTGVLRCMCDRAHQICSNTTREPELERLEEVFQANGFPKI